MPELETSTIYSSVILYGVLGFICYTVFEFSRSQQDVYAPRIRSRPRRCPPSMPDGFFRWIPHTISISDEQTLNMAGCDAFVFLHFMRTLAKFCVTCGFFGIVVLCPLYSTSPFNHLNPGIRRFTMGNVRMGDDRLWVTLFFAWGYTLYLLWLLNEEYRLFSRIRLDFMKYGDSDIPAQTNYSVVVENIPLKLRSKKIFMNFLSEIFPKEVISVYFSFYADRLERLVSYREVIKAKLESVIACYEGGGRKTVPKISVSENKPVLCYGEEQVDAVSYYQMELSRINNIISSLQREVEKMNLENKQSSDENNFDVSSTAFVTFRSVRATACAAQMPILSHEYPKLKAFFAPSPGDLVWQNVPVSLAYIENSTRFTSGIKYAGIFCWGLVIAVIAAINNIHNLERYIPGVRNLSAVSYNLLAGIVPVLLDKLVMFILPEVFILLAFRFEKIKSFSGAQQMVSQW